MRRSVLFLVLFAFSLLCQGAGMLMSPDCQTLPCCAQQAGASADAMPQSTPAQAHAPCEAGALPCDHDGCQCHESSPSALPLKPPEMLPTQTAPIAAGPDLHRAPQHVPDCPQRPPDAGAR